MVVLDNASFGKFDMDALANMWDDYELDGFGVEIPTFAPVPLDGLFEQTPSSGGEAPAPDKIIITIPEELENDKQAVLEFVSDLISDRYQGCNVSFKK